MRNKEKSILERVYTIGFNLLTALSIICFIGIIICFIIKNIIDFSSILIGIMAIGLVYSLMGLAILVLLNKLLLKIKNKELRNVKWW